MKKKQLRKDFDTINARAAKYIRAPQPPGEYTGSLHVRGMSAPVVRAFDRYCRGHGYRKCHVIEALMREMVLKRRRLNINGITPLED